MKPQPLDELFADLRLEVDIAQDRLGRGQMQSCIECVMDFRVMAAEMETRLRVVQAKQREREASRG